MSVTSVIKLIIKRFSARVLDVFFCILFFTIITLTIESHSPKFFNGKFNEDLYGYFQVSFLYIFEAFCISKFATTIGKKTFGIKIYSNDGNNLDFTTAIIRMYYILKKGVTLWHWRYHFRIILTHKQTIYDLDLDTRCIIENDRANYQENKNVVIALVDQQLSENLNKSA